MRGLLLKLALFVGLLEGLGRINLLVLISGLAVALAVVIWTDRVFGPE